MRNRFFNRWFFTALFLTIGLSAFSFVAYKQTHSICNGADQCCQHAPAQSSGKGEMIFEAVSRQFVTFISIQ